MKNTKSGLNRVLSLTAVILGNLLYAATVTLFILPAKLISCGTTGIALVVEHVLGIPISYFVMVFNLVMLALGWVALGKSFAMTTVLSSLIYPVLLNICGALFGSLRITDNLLLNVLFGGMGLGIALGVVIRAGASTGGMDIPPLILKKYLRIPVPVGLWAFDFVIMLCQMFYHTAEDLLYGVLLLMVISVTLNRVMLAGTSKTEIKIISEKSLEIRDNVLSKVDRGVTLLHGEGGYLGHPTEVILSVVSNHELPRIERIAREIDPTCFMIVSRVTEVWGRGFSYSKQYTKRTPS